MSRFVEYISARLAREGVAVVSGAVRLAEPVPSVAQRSGKALS
jgi:hypothetical protein